MGETTTKHQIFNIVHVVTVFVDCRGFYNGRHNRAAQEQVKKSLTNSKLLLEFHELTGFTSTKKRSVTDIKHS
jgi:hypothetical protein